jgi:hypothetical protein
LQRNYVGTRVLNPPIVKRLATLAVAAAVLALAPAAQARVVELGSTTSPAKSKCPNNPCEVVGRVTGYQGRSDTARNPFRVPRAGNIVAFTVNLAKLQQNQIDYFSNLYGGQPQVRLSILRKGKRKKSRLNHRLMSQSKTYDVSHFFGSTPTFALSRPLRVRRKYIVALTIPTWAPVFARDLSRSNWWRAGRRKKHCNDVTQNANQEQVGEVMTYGCTYHTARLLYTATYVPDPSPTDQTPTRRRAR